MRILLLGANGQLGSVLQKVLSSVGELKACSRDRADLTDTAALIKTIDAFKPDCLVNAAAYTAVDEAENASDLAFKVNAEAVAVLAKAAEKHNAWLIHYSTDYVFDGSKTAPYTEMDRPNPIGVYGQSKLAGEQAISNSSCKHLIFRISWVIGQYGSNFAKTILRLALTKESLKIINDQHGVPTTPDLIARVTAAALAAINITPWTAGIYHLAPQGQTTWYAIAQTLLALAKKQRLPLVADAQSLHPITTAEYPTLAQRPLNSLLNTGKLQQQLDFNLPHWEEDFLVVAKQIIKGLQTQ